MAVYDEEEYPLELGSGLYTSELPSSIPDGFVSQAYNFIASGDSLENRPGFIQTTVDYKRTQTYWEYYNCFYHLVQFDENYPVLAWPEGANIHFIRSSAELNATTPANDGYMVVNPAVGAVVSIAQYNNVTYFATKTGGIFKITAYNWAADTITFTVVTPALLDLRGMFAFKDRLWGWKGDVLHFTDIATILSPLPETWNPTTNFIPIRGTAGKCIIFSVVPLGSKLLIFTTGGLYTLLAEGSPASWILRPLDIKSVPTRGNCAFEAGGVVYFVDNRGVFATNGLEVQKISGTIDDNFFQADASIRASCHYLDDGILVSLTKHFKIGAFIHSDVDQSRLFYTKLDPIAWTEWGIEGTDTYPSAFPLGDKISEVHSVATKVHSFLSESPVTYVLLAVSHSTEAAPDTTVLQLCRYDGGHNQLYYHAGGNTFLVNDPIKMVLTSRYTDAGKPTQTKRTKYAYLEAYSSDANHSFSYGWTNDLQTNPTGGVHTMQAPSAGIGTNLLKLKSNFMYRRLSFVLEAALQTATSTFKLKQLFIINHTNRREIEESR